ncbi:peptide chain release factor N(5)-glutamine methyltransferase [Geodermatophilus obscurus]|uniref:Release factor glutamine methyltransferase n=1 Tax=Geodermatophilus obscurus (strain ATCC 25078 / DSM 43160 / JCM 3152 / CCUG 61914 / KCC A-0152 / KCTC 9177 / NBRC 13315 / NRRL B-3577 / G-20) TaxID=526225 RepID=D2SES4_GEOOG|nr:peptide chain release factor N(5)-glutamine methyltransferase [Geodermatophilus obscurus]ADB76710.1 protein-(glutamine-N5) methyltransferase, release factor-specific [Geodermatophilus obscurus DSM 43160]
MNTRSLLADAARRLADAGVESPRVDAELLLAHVLGVSRAGLLTLGEVPDDAVARFEGLAGQRADRVPLQHLTGRAPFRSLELAVGPGVFVPRPETEQLVEWALARLAGLAEPVVVDLGSGSGAIALSIAHEHPGARVTAVERDPGAIEWTRHNAASRAAAGDTPVDVLSGDMTDPGLLRELDGTVDLVVSNPPYVPDGATVPREVADHDPPLALWGGPDGLDVVRGLLRTAARLLRPGGGLGIEHADQQGGALPALVRASGSWTGVEDHPDLAGRPRYTTAHRTGG